MSENVDFFTEYPYVGDVKVSLLKERQEALRRAEEERAAAIEKEREEAVQEAIASMIPDMDAAVELYEYGIYLSPDAKEKLEMYMDSVGIEWEAR